MSQLDTDHAKVNSKEGSTPPDDMTSTSLCQHCGKGAGSGKMCMCARCKLAKYCYKACQRSHWRAHKPICAKAVELNESGDKVAKDSEAWMNENNDMLHIFMLNMLLAFGGPEMSLVHTHCGILVGTYDIAYRMIRVTDYGIIEKSGYAHCETHLTSSEELYVCLCLRVNETMLLKRYVYDPKTISSVGIQSEEEQLGRAEKAFQVLQEAATPVKLSEAQVTRSLKKHAPEDVVMTDRRISLIDELILKAVQPNGISLFGSLCAYALRLSNPATTMKNTHRVLVRIICDDDNMRIISCTAEPIDDIAQYMQRMRSGNSDIDYWRNGDESCHKAMESLGQAARVFPFLVYWRAPGDVDRAEEDRFSGLYQSPYYLTEDNIQQMESLRQSKKVQDRLFKLVMQRANDRPGTLPESCVPTKWRVPPPANGGGYTS